MDDEAAVNYRIWSPDATAPGAASMLEAGGLVLGRELLGVRDTRISRGANAPVAVQASAAAVRIRVPAGAFVAPIVVPARRFEFFQLDVPPADEPWKIAPGGLDRPERVVNASEFSVALVRGVRWDETNEPHHLLTLPRLTTVEPGSEKVLAMPFTLLLAGAAVDFVGTSTAAPDLQAWRPVGSANVAPIRARLLNPSALESIAMPPVEGPLLLPRGGKSVAWDELPEALEHALAESGVRGWCLVPAVRDDRDRVLLLAYENGQGEWRALGTAHDPAAWLARVAAELDRAARPSSAALAPSAPAPARDEPPAAAPLATAMRFGAFMTRDPAMAAVVARVGAAAVSPLGILLLGESGTGKELIAQEVHRASGRSGAFVAVNCAAIPATLIESELFGHVSGAFTGARGERLGAFVAADGGTLFLDEIGDAPLAVQVSLLRALESRRIKPVGADRDRPVDVRVIAATSRDLDRQIREERFRPDLYYRVAQLAVRLSPLRERVADIVPLAETFLETVAPGRHFTGPARAALATEKWPGNVRELKNAVERAVALAPGGDSVDATDLVSDPALGASDNERSSAPSQPPPPSDPMPVRPPAPTPATRSTPDMERSASSRLVFSELVRSLGVRALAEGSVPKPAEHSTKLARAEQRATFLYLKLEKPLTPWPASLTRQFHRAFGPRWASSEDGRGFAELMAAVGLNHADERDRAELERVLDGIAALK